MPRAVVTNLSALTDHQWSSDHQLATADLECHGSSEMERLTQSGADRERVPEQSRLYLSSGKGVEMSCWKE